MGAPPLDMLEECWDMEALRELVVSAFGAGETAAGGCCLLLICAAGDTAGGTMVFTEPARTRLAGGDMVRDMLIMRFGGLIPPGAPGMSIEEMELRRERDLSGL